MFAHNDVIKFKHFPRYWPFCAGNSLVTGEFPSQRPVTRSFDVFFDLRLYKRLSKQLRFWWVGRPSRSLWHHCNETDVRVNVRDGLVYVSPVLIKCGKRQAISVSTSSAARHGYADDCTDLILMAELIFFDIVLWWIWYSCSFCLQSLFLVPNIIVKIIL